MSRSPREPIRISSFLVFQSMLPWPLRPSDLCTLGIHRFHRPIGGGTQACSLLRYRPLRRNVPRCGCHSYSANHEARLQQRPRALSCAHWKFRHLGDRPFHRCAKASPCLGGLDVDDRVGNCRSMNVRRCWRFRFEPYRRWSDRLPHRFQSQHRSPTVCCCICPRFSAIASRRSRSAR